MIAHVAETGENRGRVVLQLGSAHPSAIALEAAVRIAQAFQSEIESVFVQQSGPTSVDWVDIHAKDASNSAVVERIRP